MTRHLPLAAIAAGLAASTALLRQAFASRERAYWLYGYASYWCMLALALAWSWLASRRLLREEARARAGTLKAALLAGLAGAAIVFAAVTPRFRVLSDETNLLGVAQSMAAEKTAYNPTVAKRYFGALHPLNREVEKRPLLFPFLVHVVHVLTGYRWQNGFVLNFLLLAALLAWAYAWASAGAGPLAGASAVALLAGYPLVALCAASSNAELLQVLLFGMMAAALASYLREPDAESWAWLWVNALAYCHTRYECFLFAALALGAAAWHRRPELAWLERYWPVFALSPLVMLPVAWQRVLIPRPFENAPGEPVFAARHLRRFLGVALKAEASPYDPLTPHAVVVDWAAALCAGGWLLARRRGVAPEPPRWKERTLWTASACLLLQALLFLCYYFGDFVHPASARFFLPLSVAAALAPVAFHRAFPDRLPASWLAAFAAASAAVYFPIAVGARHTDTLELIREERECRRWALGRGDEHSFFVYSRPGQLTVLDRGAGDFAWANAHRAELLEEMDRRLYSGVYAVQRVAYETGQPVPDDRLDPAFRLEALEELQTSAEQYLRLSRVLRR